ncbi:MAG: hypothetical protein AB8G96_00625 [Phycisphaerales bacterium]
MPHAVVTIVLIVGTMAIIGNCMHPIGIAGQDQTMADLAQRSDTAPDVAAARHAAFMRVLEDFEYGIDEARARLIAGPAADGTDNASANAVLAELRPAADPRLVLLAPDDETSRLYRGFHPEERAFERAMARVTVATLPAPGHAGAASVIDRLSELSGPPFPAADAAAMRAMGYGRLRPVSVDMSHLARFRDLARHLSVHAALSARTGDRVGFTRAMTAMEATAIAGQTVPGFIPGLVTLSIRAMVNDRIAGELHHEQVQADEIPQLLALIDRREPLLERSLRAERAVSEGLLDAWFTANGTFLPGTMVRTADGDGASEASASSSFDAGNVLNPLGWILPDRDEVHALLDAGFDPARHHEFLNTIDGARSAFGSGLPRLPYLAASMVVPNTDVFSAYVQAARTDDALLRAALRVRAFELEHGRRPRTLEKAGLKPAHAVDPVDGAPLEFIDDAGKRTAAAAAADGADAPPADPGAPWMIRATRPPSDTDRPLPPVPRSVDHR